MIAVTWIGLYPLVQFLAPWMVDTLKSWGLPEPVAVMLNVAAILVVMTYLVMPQLTRLLRRFLQA
jgi:antibiotic biosynthesis monooxygenase (ABM) superfamily enzyme